jgi:hypothetical protein
VSVPIGVRGRIQVNAGNAAAIGLYASEGFVEDKAMVCYALTFGAKGTGTF